MSRRGHLASAWVITKKELRETLRDRKTLLVMIVLPLVLYPLLILGFSQLALMQQSRLAAESLRVGLSGAPPPPALRAHLEALEATTLQPVDDPRAAVRDGAVSAALVLPDDAPAALAAEGQAAVEVVFDGASDRSRQAEERLRKALTAFADQLRLERLAARGLDERFVKPVEVDAVNVAPPERQGGWILGQILPMLISVLMIGATFYPAIDLTAGEKERGTLQTLLTAPLPPMTLVTGKYLAVVGLAMLTGVLNLASVAFVATAIPVPQAAADQLSFDIGLGAIGLVFACLLLLGMMFGAIMVAVAVTAKDYKEAQNYLTPLYLVAVMPLMASSLPGMELTTVTAAVPVLNLALAMKQLLVGPIPAPLLAVVFGSTLAWVALALVFAARVFRTEAILLGDAGFRALFHRRAPAAGFDAARPPVASVGEVVTLLGVVLLLLFYGGVLLVDAPLLVAVHVTQWGLLLTPVVLLVAGLRLDPRHALGLRRPPAWSLAAAALLGLGTWFIAAVAIEALGADWMPVPTPAMEALEQSFRDLAASPGTALLLFLGVALAPAICEEALFRGVVLRGLAPRLGARGAVVASSVAFAVYHLNLYQAPTTLLVGLILGALAIASGSLWPGVVLHALHNGLALAFHVYAGESVSTEALAVVSLGPALGLLILWRRARTVAPPGS